MPRPAFRFGFPRRGGRRLRCQAVPSLSTPAAQGDQQRKPPGVDRDGTVWHSLELTTRRGDPNRQPHSDRNARREPSHLRDPGGFPQSGSGPTRATSCRTTSEPQRDAATAADATSGIKAAPPHTGSRPPCRTTERQDQGRLNSHRQPTACRAAEPLSWGQSHSAVHRQPTACGVRKLWAKGTPPLTASHTPEPLSQSHSAVRCQPTACCTRPKRPAQATGPSETHGEAGTDLSGTWASQRRPHANRPSHLSMPHSSIRPPATPA
jgi:hypothetical protein